MHFAQKIDIRPALNATKGNKNNRVFRNQELVAFLNKTLTVTRKFRKPLYLLRQLGGRRGVLLIERRMLSYPNGGRMDMSMRM